MLSCDEIRDLASEHLDGELSGWRKLQVRAHLAMCKGCAELVRQVDLVKQAYASLGATEDNRIKPEMKAELLAAWAAAKGGN